MSTNKLHQDFLPMASQPVSGTINCSSAAPAVATDPRTAVYISLTNMSYESVDYAIYDQMTGRLVTDGALSKGNSRSVVIPASDNPNVIRIQNQTPCDSSGITPSLTYALATQS
ncbi:MAG: hypothetical protein AAFN93_06385 [Bacteroidota bacterium]